MSIGEVLWMKITVIGCGRWGSFIAWHLNKVGHNVTLYGRNTSENMKKIMQFRKSGCLSLPETIALSTDISCAQGADVIAISVSSQSLRDVCRLLSQIGIKDKTIVLCMKGLEIGTCCRLSQIAEEETDPSNKVAVWLGPGHVEEFSMGIQNCMVIDSASDDVKKMLVREFSNSTIRFYYGTDLIGSEIGAASKNVIGIAAGMLDGLGRTSLKGALMSRGTREIARLIKAAGGNELSAYGLCHLGDYQATVFSEYSHNRKYGECLVSGEKYEMLAEGKFTVKALIEMAEKLDVELPICRAVYNVIYEDASPAHELSSLFERSLKYEF